MKHILGSIQADDNSTVRIPYLLPVEAISSRSSFEHKHYEFRENEIRLMKDTYRINSSQVHFETVETRLKRFIVCETLEQVLASAKRTVDADQPRWDYWAIVSRTLAGQWSTCEARWYLCPLQEPIRRIPISNTCLFTLQSLCTHSNIYSQVEDSYLLKIFFFLLYSVNYSKHASTPARLNSRVLDIQVFVYIWQFAYISCIYILQNYTYHYKKRACNLITQ